MEDTMVFSDPDVTEVHEILLEMQKNLECPICLEVMKVPVSASCAHVFCRFCISKLLSQNNGKTKCPLCNAAITKRSLWEEVRCEQVIKAVLEAIGALEYDTGFNSLGDQCLQKKDLETASAAALQEKQTIVESKGYRDRLNGAKKGEKRKRTLQNQGSHSSIRNRTVTRCSLRKQANTVKTVCFEIGSDSSDDVFQEAGTGKRVGLRNSSWSRNSESRAEKKSQNPCHVELQKPSAEDVLLNTPGECSLSEAGPRRTEGTQASTGNVAAVEEDVTVKKRQDASFPVLCVARHSGQPVSSSTQEGGSCSLLGMERPQLASEATDPAPNRQAGNKAEPDSAVRTAGSVHTYDLMREDQQELQQPQASPNSPLSQVSGKKLKQSIKKVNEWLSKSKTLSPSPLQDVHVQEVDPDLQPHLSDVESHVSQKSEPMEDQWAVTAGSEVGRPLSKPVASQMVDKIFGRIYKRACKSSPVWNVRETIPISARESGAAVNTKSWDTPIRKISVRRKTTLELTSEDVMKEPTVMEVIREPGCNAKAASEEDGHSLAVLDETLGAEQRPAELTVKEGAPGFESDAFPICCHSNLKKAGNSLRRRNWRSNRPVCELHLAMPESSGSLEKTQAHVDDSPSREGPREGSTGQMHIRRSKRLLLWAEGQQRGSKPVRKRRKQIDRRAKKKTESQAGNVSFSEAEGGPGILHSSQTGTVGDARKVCAFLGGKDSLSAEYPTESYSPCCMVPDTSSQGNCLLMECHPPGGDQTDLGGKEFTAPEAEQSGLCTQAPEGDGFCLGQMKESCKTPKADDKAVTNGELNPETDDSELDIGFMSKIFHHCKRQSFLLHPAPVKNSPTVTPEGAEGSEAVCVKKSIPGIVRVVEERTEAVPSRVANSISGLSPLSHPSHSSEHGSRLEHLQVTSQTLFPGSSCTPVASKETESASPLWNQKPGTEKKESLEMEKITDAASLGLQRSGHFRGTNLYPDDEKSCNSACFVEMRLESTENKALACSSHPEQMQPLPLACQPPPSESSSGRVGGKSGVGEQKQRKGIGEEPGQVPSSGVSEGHLEQFSEDKTPDFQLLSDTPEDLLGPATESKECLLNPWDVDRQDTLAMFAKTDQGIPLESDLECSSSSGSRLEGMAQARRRTAQKLSSSEEDKSSEDEELPSFHMLVFGRSASPLPQPMKEEGVASADILPRKSSSRSCLKSQGENGSPSQESEGSVNLFSSQSQASEDSTSKPCDASPLAPVPTSQGKVMTPRTVTESLDKLSIDARQLQDGHQGSVNAEPNLGEALGYDSEVSHLGDSSGFSSQSEILTTQQKETMQNNLKNLQQEMAMLEAALKEGEQGAATEVLPLPRGRSVFPGGQACSARGSATKLRCRRKKSLPIASPPARSTQRTADDHSGSPPASQEHISCCLAAEPGKESPIAIQYRASTPELESEGKPISSFATSVCSGRKRNCKSLLLTSKRSMSLASSGLFPDELRLVQKFARKTKSAWSNTISDDTTHVVMKTDEDLVCERTLKYFLGIAAQKWVVSYQWVLQSLREGRVLNEGDFEVRGDVINGRNHQGPKRARESSTPRKLFQGLEVCCYGPFTDMQREQLERMVELCGASLVKQPHLFSCSANSADAVVVIQPEAWTEDTDCQGIPPPWNATIVAREWVLDSIACYQRMALDGYIIQQA